MYAKVFKANPQGINQYTPGGMKATTGAKKPGSISMIATPSTLEKPKPVTKQTEGWGADMGFVHKDAPQPKPLTNTLLAQPFVPKDKATNGFEGMFGCN